MTTLPRALADLLHDHTLSVEDAADRHLSPGFHKRVNGQRIDRAAFVARIADLRRTGTQATITVLDEVRDDRRYAERHVIDLLDPDGTRIVQEVHVFATLDADGKFERIDEATFTPDAVS